MGKDNITSGIFDIRPIISGIVGIDDLNNLTPVIDLSGFREPFLIRLISEKQEPEMILPIKIKSFDKYSIKDKIINQIKNYLPIINLDEELAPFFKHKERKSRNVLKTIPIKISYPKKKVSIPIKFIQTQESVLPIKTKVSTKDIIKLKLFQKLKDYFKDSNLKDESENNFVSTVSKYSTKTRKTIPIKISYPKKKKQIYLKISAIDTENILPLKISYFKSNLEKERVYNELTRYLVNISLNDQVVLNKEGQINISKNTKYKRRRNIPIKIGYFRNNNSLPRKFNLDSIIETKNQTEKNGLAKSLDLDNILSDIMTSNYIPSMAAKELDVLLENIKNNQLIINSQKSYLSSPHQKLFSSLINYSLFKSQKILKKYHIILFAFILISFFAIIASLFRVLTTKNEIIQKGNLAYLSLTRAKDSLEKLKFSEAVSEFSLAIKNLDLVQEGLNNLSNSLLGFVDQVSFRKISNVSDLSRSAKLIALAGEDFSRVLNDLSKVNIISFLNPTAISSNKSILDLLKPLRLSLINADRNLNQANKILLKLDEKIVPEDKREIFKELKSKLPEFLGFTNKAVNYLDFLVEALGQNGVKRYIILFQNTSELRASGGFWGSYALVEFEKGIMKKFAVDDIYNPDGQIKENIIPPLPLQRISPNWGLRDSNWFVNFPTSAKKAIDFYLKGTGILVDGVIALNVDLIPKILKLTGSIEMPDFGLTLDSDNFLPLVQKEVEYIQTKGRPKQILVELAPRLLEKLANFKDDNWLNLLSIFIDAVDSRDLMAYFVDKKLQEVALDNNFAGEIKANLDDYLMVVYSNIAGGKTDVVTNNSIELKLEVDSDNNLIHLLSINRANQGGDTEYGFYNRPNKSYIRVLVPLGSELISIGGNDIINVVPLLDYEKEKFVTDDDLKIYESKIYHHPDFGVDVFEEGGKTVFGFWLITEPKKTKIVTLKYKTPYKLSDNYGLYVQKQSGAKNNFKFSFRPPKNKLISEVYPQDGNISLIGNNLNFSKNLDKDIDLLVKFK